MTTPAQDGPAFSSSPVSVTEGSPTRGRGGTSLHAGEPTDIIQRPRLPPAFGRSYDPNDPDARERQRTMDVDMAMHLSRARQESSPDISPYEHSHLPRHEPAFSSLSYNEEHDLHLARGERIPDMHDDYMHVPLGPPRDHTALHESIIPSEPHFLSPGERPVSASGLPTYHANNSSSHFDFSAMEQYAAQEKTKLGIVSFDASANVRKQPSGSPSLNSAVDHEDGPGTSISNTRARHRKLSQSEARPRQRKGIGGKIAQFEGNIGETIFSNRLLSSPATFRPQTASGHSATLPYPFNLAQSGGVSATLPGILTSGHDRPYRFSFYSNALSATIHARSLSELPAEGQTFEDLFKGQNHSSPATAGTGNGPSTAMLRTSEPQTPAVPRSTEDDGYFRKKQLSSSKTPGVGAPLANTWWLDVQCPTDDEMKMLSTVFNIHPLTTEDIQMEETREKIELFRNYYLVCFRGFDQDPYSPTHLEPLNMYIIVFREGILSFHSRPTPHPQNVRRRIKQLKDYISVTSDWISYALIDDITDAFGPLIQSIEYEVDSIDELVLILKDAEQSDMLRRIGACRKKVMGLLRLMGNKADVVKGLAKRCNENWRVAPTSDIGLYLSDIQDHLITMTQNLNHYEKILSRSHSNYLAQISIEMTDANNQINDVLSKLTALGTVLIPMNLVTGIWGMNVHVPGQDVDGFAWFASILGSLAAFAIIGGYTTYKYIINR